MDYVTDKFNKVGYYRRYLDGDFSSFHKYQCSDLVILPYLRGGTSVPMGYNRHYGGLGVSNIHHVLYW